MDKAHRLLNISYQRSISPDYRGFFQRFYQIFSDTEPRVKELFAETEMERQYKMLMESMTYLISYVQADDSGDAIKKTAVMHGRDRLDIPAGFYDIWLESLIETIKERDPEFNDHIEKAWRKVLAPGIDYMKSFSR